jgi:hypothetical protein
MSWEREFPNYRRAIELISLPIEDTAMLIGLLSYPIPETPAELPPSIHLEELRQAGMEFGRIQDLVKFERPNQNDPARWCRVVK